MSTLGDIEGNHAQKEGTTMRSCILRNLNNPIRLCVKVIALLALIAVILHGAYTQGVQHAIATAAPCVEGDTILIDYDGQMHIYE